MRFLREVSGVVGVVFAERVDAYKWSFVRRGRVVKVFMEIIGSFSLCIFERYVYFFVVGFVGS